LSRETSPPGSAGGTPEKEIAGLIEARGRITFAEFMDLALYSPHGGYYTSGRERWGPGGDYITSPDVSPAFARTIARQVSEFYRLLGSPPVFRLIEAGAGRASLITGIIEALCETEPRLHDALDAAVVERGQARAVTGTDVRVELYPEMASLPAGGAGCIISNELIDSFPVHRVRGGGAMQEVYVALEDGRLVDSPGPLSTPELARYFDLLGLSLAPGQGGEVNLGAAAWLKSAASVLDKGFVVTIDYGWPARELYSPERMAGSLLCHYRHTVNHDPYARIGLQDITAHVDFTTLALRGLDAGLALTGFTTQKNFLLGLGVLEEMRAAADLDLENFDNIRHNQDIGRLIMPGGMGDTFKVLVQHTGLGPGAQPRLSGFSFKEMSAYLGLPVQ